MKGAIYYVAIATVIFSNVKISSFCAKAHLVFHWCLSDKRCYAPEKSGYKTRLIILTMFLVRTITTRTLLEGTLTVTPIPTLRPTLALLRQRLYRTSEAPLKLLQ